MANVKLTCGHWLVAYEEPVMLSVKDYSRMGEKVSSYGSYCKQCALAYEAEGLVLHNEKEIKEWFNLKE